MITGKMYVIGFSARLNIPKVIGYKKYASDLAFVPKHMPPKSCDLERLKCFLENSGKLCVLTGAGISTESGIPDYRSEDVGLYATSSRRPVLYQDFRDKEHIRQRYWARNYIAWPRFSSFEPNDTHKALKYLEDFNRVSCIVTQNVDGLHSKAGSGNVIELHGTSYTVMCLNCDKKMPRHDFQKVLDQLNPTVRAISVKIRPDGDIELSEDQIREFKMSPCSNCGGILKPDIVFFGDNVARRVVEAVEKNINEADALLVLGTSLTTFSGYRIILHAMERKKPIAIVNIGETKADKYAIVKVDSRCGVVLGNLIPTLNFTRGIS